MVSMSNTSVVRVCAFCWGVSSVALVPGIKTYTVLTINIIVRKIVNNF